MYEEHVSSSWLCTHVPKSLSKHGIQKKVCTTISNSFSTKINFMCTTTCTLIWTVVTYSLKDVEYRIEHDIDSVNGVCIR